MCARLRIGRGDWFVRPAPSPLTIPTACWTTRSTWARSTVVCPSSRPRSGWLRVLSCWLSRQIDGITRAAAVDGRAERRRGSTIRFAARLENCCRPRHPPDLGAEAQVLHLRVAPYVLVRPGASIAASAVAVLFGLVRPSRARDQITSCSDISMRWRREGEDRWRLRRRAKLARRTRRFRTRLLCGRRSSRRLRCGCAGSARSRSTCALRCRMSRESIGSGRGSAMTLDTTQLRVLNPTAEQRHGGSR